MWRCPDRAFPDLLAWHGDLVGPSTAARLANGTVVSYTEIGERVHNSVEEACATLGKPPDVCLDESLAILMQSPLVYGERCSLNDVSWCALGTGIASPYALARVLKLMITGRRCRVRLRTIPAGRHITVVNKTA